MRRTLTLTALTIAALTIAGCASAPAGSPGSSSSPSAEPSPSATRTPFQTTTPGAIAPSGTPTTVPAARWDAIVSDLADRGITAEPELVTAEAVTFSDGSLGCATPGQSYTQAQVDGMRVVVTADGQSFDYRFGTGDSPTLCTR